MVGIHFPTYHRVYHGGYTPSYIPQGVPWWVYTPLYTTRVYTPGYTVLPTAAGVPQFMPGHTSVAGREGPGLKLGERPGYEAKRDLLSPKV